MFYGDIRTKQDLSYISICSLSILYNSKFIILATSLGTNAVVVTRVHCIIDAFEEKKKELLAAYTLFLYITRKWPLCHIFWDQRLRSGCLSGQFDQGLHCLLTQWFVPIEYIMEQGRPLLVELCLHCFHMA